MDTWRNECFGKMDDLLVHTTPNHHPPKMDILPKTFRPIILASKQLVWPPKSSDDLYLLYCLNILNDNDKNHSIFMNDERLCLHNYMILPILN